MTRIAIEHRNQRLSLVLVDPGQCEAVARSACRPVAVMRVEHKST
jgi:hypothetical protein